MNRIKRVLLECHWVVTRWYLRSRGAKVGRGVRCNGFPRVKLKSGGLLVLEARTTINASPWSNAHVVRGSTNFYVGPGAKLVLREGAGVSGTRIVAMDSIEIGRGSLIGGGALICDSDMHEVPLDGGGPVRKAKIIIGSRVFVGAGAVILKGVQVGDGAVVGAGTVVSRDVPPVTLVAGEAARIVRRFADEGKHQARSER